MNEITDKFSQSEINDFSEKISPKAYSRRKGDAGEKFACEFLVSKGHTILCRNYACKGGEIDIISKYDEYIVFTEVKTRSGKTSPMTAVTRKKIETVKRCANVYLAEKNLNVFSGESVKVRIDIVSLRYEKDGTIKLLSHIEGLNLLKNMAERF